MNVYDNIAFGLVIKKLPKSEIDKKVKDILSMVSLSGFEKRSIDSLSGGQQQRVAIARALVNEPEVLLLDEPLGALDLKLRKEMQLELKKIQQRLGITFIFVTHDQEEAVEVADEIIVTNRGRIEQKGSPIEIYKNPKTPFVAQFIGESTIVDNYSALKGFDDIGDDSKAVVRPEFIQIGKNRDEISVPSAAETGIITSVSFRGNNIQIEVQVGENKLIGYRTLEDEPLKEGDEVLVLIHRIYVYNNKETKTLENKLKVDPMPIYI